ncbi:MAG: carboxypeptidase regulatory-like domain-containing protein [Deltaproteobacteria bacterium]|nr:carboxypeptidase regulatory-like domain-containing protein [Deltaproteobacteria bacterium]MBW2307337.1 carboxypeptidase regulatory-like domain-containing protein [Deltaproteobacteria bacterium]
MRRLELFRGWVFVPIIVLMGMMILPGLVAGEDFIVRGTSQAGVSYMTGGIGLEERATITKEAKNYTLWLEFDISSGNYLSAVEVMIKDAKGGVVIEENSMGPWFLASLPAGNYLVSAKALNKAIVMEVEVPAGGKITLTWQ